MVAFTSDTTQTATKVRVVWVGTTAGDRTNFSSTVPWDEEYFNSAQEYYPNKEAELPRVLPPSKPGLPRLDRCRRMAPPSLILHVERRWVVPPRGRAANFTCKNFRRQKKKEL